MKRLKAFLLGVIEYRTDWTTSYDEPLILWYDSGRALARHVTGLDKATE